MTKLIDLMVVIASYGFIMIATSYNFNYNSTQFNTVFFLIVQLIITVYNYNSVNNSAEHMSALYILQVSTGLFSAIFSSQSKQFK